MPHQRSMLALPAVRSISLFIFPHFHANTLMYLKDRISYSASKPDGTVRLQREVVLLTDDRNLRVKALTRNVPVRDIPSFLSWAKVG